MIYEEKKMREEEDGRDGRTRQTMDGRVYV